jgi:hypothetical protein
MSPFSKSLAELEQMSQGPLAPIFCMMWPGCTLNSQEFLRRLKPSQETWLFAILTPAQRKLDRLKQCIFAERLVQEIHSAFFDRLFSVALVRSGRDKNDTRGRSLRGDERQIFLVRFSLQFR